MICSVNEDILSTPLTTEEGFTLIIFCKLPNSSWFFSSVKSTPIEFFLSGKMFSGLTILLL